MKKAFLLCLALVAFFGVRAQTSFSDFNTIDVTGPFKITLIPAATEKVQIDYNGVDHDDVMVEEHHGCLYVKMRSKHYFEEWDWADNHFPTVYLNISYKSLSELRAEAGARIEANDPIDAQTIYLTGSMGATIDVPVKAQKVIGDASMGAELFLSGDTEHLVIDARMGSQVSASRLQCKSAEVHSTMGAEANLTVTEEIDASASFGGTINYSGGAAAQHTSTNFGGMVSGY